jgi:polyribonucleotide nucleotidyltransferase
MKLHEETMVGGRSLSLTTGDVAKQADGAVTVRYGDTVVLVTGCAKREELEGANFLPLTVDYREYTFAAGKIPGGFFRREGRPSEAEILAARLIDRSLRPLFPEGYANDSQVIASVLSYDMENEPDVISIVGAGAALVFSEIPFAVPLGAVRIGHVDGALVVNPGRELMERSNLDLIAVASEEAIVMVEAGAKEASEELMLEALELARGEALKIIEMVKKMAASLGKQKWAVEPTALPAEIASKAVEQMTGPIGETLAIADKQARGRRFDELNTQFVEQYPEDGEERALAGRAFSELKQKIFREGVFKNKRRFDGRGFEDVRQVSCELQFLPRTHGSSLFTRGETQALVTATLGARSDAQIMDELEGEWKRRFMLHYNFPPFSVGEVKFLRGASRREIGHGALAHRALDPVLPPEEEFPYTIRLVSDILESNGSSSMATVCGGSLALFDCGVPVRAAVAGVAMGLMKSDNEFIVLTDIAGEEDHYGDMDFKIAGTRQGITALQMDIKISGVTTEILRQALEQAKRARLHILDIMDATIDKPRAELSPYAPRIVTLKIDPMKIRDIIGKGGAIIRSIVEESGAEIDVEDDGTVLIYSPNSDSLEKAKQMIESIVEEPELNKIYLGKVVSITDFGAFVQILPSVQGLLHVSEIANYRVNQVSDELSIGDEVPVKVIEIDKANGKVRLSRKAVLKERDGGKDGGGRDDQGGPRGDQGGGRGDRGDRSGRRSGPRGGGGSRPPRRDNRERSQNRDRYPSDSNRGGNPGSSPGGSPGGGRRRGGRDGRGVAQGGNRTGDGKPEGNRRDGGSDPNKGFRFPGNLGPDPHDPGGLGGPRNRW